MRCNSSSPLLENEHCNNASSNENDKDQVNNRSENNKIMNHNNDYLNNGDYDMNTTKKKESFSIGNLLNGAVFRGAIWNKAGVRVTLMKGEEEEEEEEESNGDDDDDDEKEPVQRIDLI